MQELKKLNDNFDSVDVVFSYSSIIWLKITERKQLKNIRLVYTRLRAVTEFSDRYIPSSFL